MNESDIKNGVYKYFVRVEGPPIKHGQSTLYSTDEFGGGYVEVIKILEGTEPRGVNEVRHVVYAGGFKLNQNPNKTPEEFMKEIKDGVASLVSDK